MFSERRLPGNLYLRNGARRGVQPCMKARLGDAFATEGSVQSERRRFSNIGVAGDCPGSKPQKCSSNTSVKFNVPEFCFVEQEQFSPPSKTKVRNSAVDQDFPQQDSSRRPDVHAVSTSTIDVTVHVAFDSIRDTCVTHREETAVDEKRLPRYVVDVKCVAVKVRKLRLMGVGYLTSWKLWCRPWFRLQKSSRCR
jgi:hypothetical protein